MNSIAANSQLADRSGARKEFPGRLEQVLQPLEDEIRDGDLTELMADALAEDPRMRNLPCATWSSKGSVISWADRSNASTIMAGRSRWTASSSTGRNRR